MIVYVVLDTTVHHRFVNIDLFEIDLFKFITLIHVIRCKQEVKVI